MVKFLLGGDDKMKTIGANLVHNDGPAIEARIQVVQNTYEVIPEVLSSSKLKPLFPSFMGR